MIRLTLNEHLMIDLSNHILVARINSDPYRFFYFVNTLHIPETLVYIVLLFWGDNLSISDKLIDIAFLFTDEPGI